jgi:formylglycine-generating enzyme required for sulfatase activity
MSVSLLSSGLVSCGSAPVAEGQVPTVDKVDDQQATCKVAKDPLNPLIVEWPGTSKAALDSASQRGIVVVSYVGCALKVLTQCKAGQSYEFRSVTPIRDKISMATESDIYARLPLGAAALKGELATAGQLDLEYVVVGQREAVKPPSMLQGDCQGATHYLRSIMVGAYGLSAVGKAKAGVGAGMGQAGIGGSHREEVRRLRGSGDVEQCAAVTDASSTASCNAVLQLGLAPLMASGGGAVTSAGFGEGLGAVAVVPEVGDLQALPGGGGGMADADVALLELLQSAKRADKSQTAPLGKAAAWQKLSAYEGKNPYRELGTERQSAWERVAEAEERRKEQVAKVCAKYATDSAKLRKLLSLDDDVVSAKQKAAYKAELGQVYGAFGKVLEECRANATREAAAGEAARAAARLGVLVSIPAGTFEMGSNDGDADERPVHAVRLTAFAMDRTPVTVAAYQQCVSAGRCSAPNGWDYCNGNKSDRQDHPINCVDWNQATAFCQYAGKRLPTEEEWEYAARGTDGRKYPWGNAAPGNQLCWNRRNSKEGTCAVGSYSNGASPFGILDMAGNVWEWTSSNYSDDYSKSRANATRVLRGGSWFPDGPSGVRAAYRIRRGPALQDSNLGFRCARST